MAGTTIRSTGLVMDWPTGFSQQLTTGPWLVVHALPRQDKLLIERLRAHRLPGIAFFERRFRLYPGKGTQESVVPLLGGYVFVAAGREQREMIWATGRTVRIIDVSDPDTLTNDLRSLCAVVTASTAPLLVRPEITPGKRVTITEGTFAGCSGVVTRRQHQLELVVNLALLNTSVAVTLPAKFAELVPLG